MGLPKRLTEMQMRFAELLVFGDETGPLTQTEAAVKAGYSPKRARQEGSELCNPRLSPLVVKYIGELEKKDLKNMKSLTRDTLQNSLDCEKQLSKKGSFSSAVNAEANRGKAAGLYIDRKIIKTGKLEDLSEQELENKMKQILPITTASTRRLLRASHRHKSSESSSPTDEESSSDPQK